MTESQISTDIVDTPAAIVTGDAKAKKAKAPKKAKEPKQAKPAKETKPKLEPAKLKTKVVKVSEYKRPPRPDLTQDIVEFTTVRDQLLAEFPELAEDEAALWDTVDGEVNLGDILATMARRAKELEAEAGAIKKLEEDLKSRRSKKEAAIAKIETLLLNTIVINGIKSVERADIKVRQQFGAAPLIIDVEAERLPPDFQRETKTIAADKALIRKALSDGYAVEGCRLGSPEPQLRIVV